MLLVSLMMIAWASWPPIAAGSRQRRIATATDAPGRAPTWPRQRARRRSSAALPHRTVRDPAMPALVHHRAYLSELLGTTALLFGTMTFVRWLFSNDSALAHALPGLHLRILGVGLAVGILLFLLIISPLGRSSGGHFNPAVTVAFWLLRALPGEDVAPYVTAQALGSVAGTALARLVWGAIVSRSPVAYAVIQPARGSTQLLVFILEAASIIALMAAVTFFLARPALVRWTPAVVGVAVAALISTTGAWTGGSFNPARQLGPALLSGQHAFLACYLVGPLAGALAVAALRRPYARKRVLSCQLCGA
jgi:glycerol uptake facilitator-like aquaporin